jgi:hypothetical protein
MKYGIDVPVAMDETSEESSSHTESTAGNQLHDGISTDLDANDPAA